MWPYLWDGHYLTKQNEHKNPDINKLGVNILMITMQL